MPALRLILLVVFSLGMQMPGLRLELCLCRGIGDLFHGHEPVVEEPSCCDAPRAAAPEEGKTRIARSCEGECSGCFEVTTHGHPPIAVPQSGTTPASAVPIGPAVATLRPRACARVRSATARAHGPPRARMNLPLRI